MKKLTSTLPHMLLSLGLVCIVAAALLAGMYMVTKEPIAQMEQKSQLEAIRKVAPEFNNNPVQEADTVTTADGTRCVVFPAKKDGSLVGAAIQTSSMAGFGGEIRVMVGFTADGTVKDYEVLSHAETPGLGSKMQLWFRDPKGARSILEKNPGTVHFFVSKDKAQEGQIDGITAATISSRAFLSSVRDAFEAYMSYQGKTAPKQHDATTGASKHNVK